MADRLRVHLSHGLLDDPLVYSCYKGDHTAEELILARVPDWKIILKPVLPEDVEGNEEHAETMETLFTPYAHTLPSQNTSRNNLGSTFGSTQSVNEETQNSHQRKNKGQTILHAAAYFGNRTLLQSLLELPQSFLKQRLEQLRLKVRHWACDHNVTVMAGAAKQLFEEDAALERSNLPQAERERIEKNKRMQRRLVESLEDIERLKVIHKEISYQSMLSNLDAIGRCPLHYCASSKEALSCDTLLSVEQYAGDFSGVGISGRPLFPKDARICLVTGSVLPEEVPQQDKSPQLLPPMYQEALEWCECALKQTGHPEYSADISETSLLLHTFSCLQGMEDVLNTPSQLGKDPTLGGTLAQPPSVSVRSIERQRQRIVQLGESRSGGAPLHVAAVCDNVRAIRCLLHHGARPDAEMEGGITPIELATEALAKNVQNPLRRAVEQACGVYGTSKQTTQTSDGVTADTNNLLDQFSMGVSARSRGVAGGIPLGTGLHAAAEYGRGELVKLFVENGADVDELDANGMSPLMLAAAHSRGGERYRNVSEALIEAGADVNATSSMQRTALHFTAAATSFPVSKQHLVDPVPHRCDESTQDATQHCTGAMIALLVHAGAIIDARDHRGDTPLHYAAYHNNYVAVDVLLRLGAYIYAKNTLNNTAMHVGSFVGAKQVLRQLARFDCEFGMLKSLRNSQNKYAFDIAKSDDVRKAMDSIWECAAAGKLNKIYQMFRDAELARQRSGKYGDEHGSEVLVGMWRIQQPWETTRVLKRGLLHCLIIGCARKRRELWMSSIESKSKGQRSNPWTDFRHVEVGMGDTKGAFARGTSGSLKGISLRSGTGLPSVTGPLARSISGVRQPNDPDLEPPTPSSANLDAGLGYFYNRYGKLDEHYSLYPEKRARDKKLPGVTVDWQEVYNKDAELQRHYGRMAGIMVKQGGLDLDGGDVDGVTPIMLAARYGVVELMKALINLGASIGSCDNEGNSALHWAYAYNQKQVCNVLENIDLRRSEQQGTTTEVEADTDNYQHRRRHCQLLNIRNNNGLVADEVAGEKWQILETCTEQLLEIAHPPMESESLCVSHPEELSRTTLIKDALQERTLKLTTTRRGS
eukprot:gb/GECG01008164.1/.p1 GENE.gb/GECG01008164.1/~~gb/GECG01008164.1/.p1  ORF type:complete len:1099 (+),score=129.01 gb/GECG01008164.1/:1-3297(+)